MAVLIATCADFMLAELDISLENQDGNTGLEHADNFTVYDEQGNLTRAGTPKSECIPGERPDPADCSKYYWCVEKPAGTFAEYHEDCPGNLVYNPHARMCVSSTSYTCIETAQYPYPPPYWPSPPPPPPYWPPQPPYWPPPRPPPYWSPPPPPTTTTTTTTTTRRTTTTPNPPTCTGYGYICISDTMFSMCAERGRPFESDIPCPQGYFCNEKCSFPCLNYIPDC